MGYSNSLTRRRRELAVGEGPTVSPATTYAGVLSTPFVAPAMKTANTLLNGFVRQIDGIQNKAVISSLTSTDPMQAANCDWADGDDLTLGERVLTLTDLSVMQALCRNTILPTWAGMGGARESMSAGSPEFVTFCMATVAGASAQSVENAIWRSNGAIYTGGFLSNDGTFLNAGYNASILGVAGAQEATVAATGFAAAILTVDSGCFDVAYAEALASCPAILSRPDIAFYVSPKTAGAYMTQLALAGDNQGVNLSGTNQRFEGLQYLGIPIHVCNGMFDDALVLTYEENLVVGSNLGTDYTSANYIDAWQYDGSDQVKIALRYGLGCQVGIPTDVVVGAYAAIFA